MIQTWLTDDHGKLELIVGDGGEAWPNEQGPIVSSGAPLHVEMWAGGDGLRFAFRSRADAAYFLNSLSLLIGHLPPVDEWEQA